MKSEGEVAISDIRWIGFDADIVRERLCYGRSLPENTIPKKKSRALALLNIVSTLISLESFDFILIIEATLLVRVRAPPETWTTRLEPCGQPEPALLADLFRLVTIFSNDCSKFQQFAK